MLQQKARHAHTPEARTSAAAGGNSVPTTRDVSDGPNVVRVNTQRISQEAWSQDLVDNGQYLITKPYMTHVKQAGHTVHRVHSPKETAKTRNGLDSANKTLRRDSTGARIRKSASLVHNEYDCR